MAVSKSTTFSESNISIINNTSTLTITVYFSPNNTQTYFYDPTALNCTCNGVTKTNYVTLQKGGSVTSKFVFENIPHNDDGTKTVSWKWNCNTGTSVLGNISDSGTRALTTIPRASDISCNSPIVMGTTQTVTVTQKSTSFSHILYYKTSLGDYVEIGRNTGVLDNSYSWAVPDITASLPSATSDNYTLRVLTYLNETYEGDALESLLTVVATVPASYVPTIEITNVIEGNSAVPSTFPYIVGYSKPKITTRFTGSAGSTCVSRSVNVGNETQTSTSTEQDVQFQMMLSLLATTNTIRANTTDSRGRKGSTTQTISAYAYVRPNIQLDCTRCDVDGSVNALGDYIKVRAKWNYDSVNNKNSATIKTYQDGTLKNTYTPTSTSSSDWTELVIISASSTQQYTIRLDMTDLLDTASVSQIVSKAVLPLSTFDDGNELGVSFGRMATEEGFRNYMNEYVTSGKSFNLLDTNGRQVLKTIVMDKIFEFVDDTTMNTAIQTAIDSIQDVYSTNEVKTNKVWIDGKPVYRRAFRHTGSTITISANTWTNTNILNSNMNAIINCFVVSRNGTYFPFWAARDSGNYVRLLSPRYSEIVANDLIVLEYTKTTD